jgi:hypothetical protein
LMSDHFHLPLCTDVYSYSTNGLRTQISW